MKILDALHNPADGKKPRTYRERARKDYLKYTRCRKHTAKMTRKAIGKQLAHLRRDLDAVDAKLSLGKSLTTRQMGRLDTIRTIYEQQKYMYDNRIHSVPDRIVSVSQPFVRPIVRGKAGKPVEFGAKLDISVVDGWTRLECCSFDAYNEAGNLQEMAEWFRERERHYPSRILADKIYRNRENLKGFPICPYNHQETRQPIDFQRVWRVSPVIFPYVFPLQAQHILNEVLHPGSAALLHPLAGVAVHVQSKGR